MKFAINQTPYTIILLGGKVKLWPAGSPNNQDRFPIQDRLLNESDIKRFVELGKIRLVSPEDLNKPHVQVNHSNIVEKEVPPEPPSLQPPQIQVSVENKENKREEETTSTEQPAEQAAETGRRRRRRQ